MIKEKGVDSFLTQWNELREAALRLDFPSKILVNLNATVYLEKGATIGEVLLNEENCDLSESHSFEVSENYRLWRFSSVYKLLLAIEEVIDCLRLPIFIYRTFNGS